MMNINRSFAILQNGTHWREIAMARNESLLLDPSLVFHEPENRAFYTVSIVELPEAWSTAMCRAVQARGTHCVVSGKRKHT